MPFFRNHLLILAGGLCLAFAGCQKKLDPLASTERFFEQMGHGQAAEAFASSAFAFQAQQDGALFQQTARELGLADFTSASFQPPVLKERSAEVQAEIVTKDGSKLELIVVLTDESGAWRVAAIKKPRSAQSAGSANLFSLLGKGSSFQTPLDHPLPSPEETQQLVQDALLLLNEGVREKSFTKFYSQVSRTWQNNLTVGQLERAFQPLIDENIDLAAISGSKAKFDPEPFINTEGSLILQGFYPTKPAEVVFVLKFVHETPKWKLLGLTVSFRQVKPE